MLYNVIRSVYEDDVSIWNERERWSLCILLIMKETNDERVLFLFFSFSFCLVKFTMDFRWNQSLLRSFLYFFYLFRSHATYTHTHARVCMYVCHVFQREYVWFSINRDDSRIIRQFQFPFNKNRLNYDSRDRPFKVSQSKKKNKKKMKEKRGK